MRLIGLKIPCNNLQGSSNRSFLQTEHIFLEQVNSPTLTMRGIPTHSVATRVGGMKRKFRK